MNQLLIFLDPMLSKWVPIHLALFIKDQDHSFNYLDHFDQVNQEIENNMPEALYVTAQIYAEHLGFVD